MRDIRFRGKQCETNKFFYGDLLNKPYGTYIGFKSNENDDFDDEYFYTQVEPSTVGQYIGLKDKNGKEIYEGDIIVGMSFMKAMVNSWNEKEKKSENNYGDDIYEIRYERGSFRLFKDGKWIAVIEHHVSSFVKDLEVIGNIHENPKLLKSID